LTSQNAASKSKRQATPDQVASARSTALGFGPQIDSAVSTLRNRLSSAHSNNLISDAEFIEMDNFASATSSETDTIVSELADATSNSSTEALIEPIAEGIVAVGAPELAAGAGIATVGASGLFLEWALFKSLVDAIKSNAGAPTSTTPLPSITAVAPTASAAPTGQPTNDYVLVFNKAMNKLLYNVLKAGTFVGGGVLNEDFQASSVNWWSFYANLTDQQASAFLNQFPLTLSINRNDAAIFIDSDDFQDPEGPEMDDPNPDPDVAARSSFESHRNATAGTTGRAGNFKRDDPATFAVNIAPPTAGTIDATLNFLPFHLQWLSNIWAKSEISGLCK
jgi:hypothetical protein